VAERTKASAATRVRYPGRGRHFSSDNSRCPPGAWQKSTGAPFEILPKQPTHEYQPTQSKNPTVPTPHPMANVAAGYLITKKKINII